MTIANETVTLSFNRNDYDILIKGGEWSILLTNGLVVSIYNPSKKVLRDHG